MIETGFQILLDELQNNYLEVVLIPSQRGDGMIRAVQNQNAHWYQDFCKNNLSNRIRKNKHCDTIIKRRNIIRLLKRLVNGQKTTSKYFQQLKIYAERELDALEDAPF